MPFGELDHDLAEVVVATQWRQGLRQLSGRRVCIRGGVFPSR
jgi:hypothetical protein